MVGKSLWSTAPGGGLTANSVGLVVAARSEEELDSVSAENLFRKSPQEPFFSSSSYSGLSAVRHFHRAMVKV